MTKLSSHLIFLGCLSTILVSKLNFDPDELFSSKEIAVLVIPLAVVTDILFVKMLASQLVLLTKVNLSSL